MKDRRPTVGERLGCTFEEDQRYHVETFETGDDHLLAMAALLVYAAPGEIPDGWYAIEPEEREQVWETLRPEEQRLVLEDGTLPTDEDGDVDFEYEPPRPPPPPGRPRVVGPGAWRSDPRS